MVEEIILYTNSRSPYGIRAEIALAEAKAKYKRYELDPYDQPEWYQQLVNPTGQVPALAYGGPDVPEDKPSLESAKIGESMAIVQLVAELFPESGLLPSDPVERAKARFFIDVVNNQFRLAYVGYLRQGQPGSDVLKSAALLEKMLVGKFALGDRFSVADVAFAPILLTATLAFEVKDPEGVLPQLQGHKRLWQYLQDVKARPSVANLWNDEETRQFYKKRFQSELQS